MRYLSCLVSIVAACGGSGMQSPSIDAAVAGADANPLIAARPYDLQVPSSYDGSKAVPLVLMLHGYGANAFVENAILMTPALAEQEGFLLASPEGLVDSHMAQYWNATDACCDLDGTGVDDVAYLTAVLDDVAAHYQVDPKRVFVIGHSNGGFMANRLACDRAPRIAAFLSLAGAVWKDPTKCAPSEPVAALEVHGDMDDVILYDGTAAYPSAHDTVATWAAKDGCTGALADDPTRLDLAVDVTGAETTVARYAGCPAGGGAELWTIHGANHVPNFGNDWSSAVWAYFTAHPKP